MYAQCFDDAWAEAAVATLLSEPSALAFVSDSGFIVCRIAADEAEVLWIAVRPAARRAGMAKSLLRTSLSALESLDVSRVFLEVSSNNAPACALYSAEGFALVGRRAAYYPDGAEALVLARTLHREGLSGQA